MSASGKDDAVGMLFFFTIALGVSTYVQSTKDVQVHQWEAAVVGCEPRGGLKSVDGIVFQVSSVEVDAVCVDGTRMSLPVKSPR